MVSQIESMEKTTDFHIEMAPTNDAGRYICARSCGDDTRCLRTVSLPLLSCYDHDRSAPILSTD